MQAAGFPMGAEQLAVDLADTLVTVTDPPTDLIAGQADSDRFWRLQDALLPPGWAAPAAERTRLLRDAVRRLLDAAERGGPVDEGALATINAAAAAAQPEPALELAEGELRRVDLWRSGDPADLALAAAARAAIDVLTDPDLRARLRRCASSACSMLYVRGDARRRWCTPNVCGNRDRVARHYRRHRAATGEGA
jgi:predicted RNA-binding Zn ribbon-like protein